jgi:hypothetical protein
VWGTPWFSGLDESVQLGRATLGAVNRGRVEALGVQRVGLPARVEAILARVEQEHERIAERDVHPAHPHEPVHVVMRGLHQQAHLAEVGRIEDVVLGLLGYR